MSDNAEQPSSTPAPTTPSIGTPTTTDNSTSSSDGGGKTLLTGDGPKPAEPAKEAEPAAAPLTVADIKLPEGLSASEEALASFVEIMNGEYKSPAERAAALIDLQADLMKGASEAMAKQWSDLQTDWVKEVEADPALGAETLGNIREFIIESMGDDVKKLEEALFITGAGNNPWIIRLLAKAASVVREGRPVDGKAPPAAPVSLAKQLYPNNP